jgi:hypothetical protein
VIRVYRGGNQSAPPMIDPSPNAIPVLGKEPESSGNK